MGNLVDRHLGVIDGQRQQIEERREAITGELEDVQARRKRVAFAAHLQNDAAAQDRLRELEARATNLRSEHESLGFVLERIAEDRIAMEARRSEVERMEKEYATREEARLEACARAVMAIDVSIPMVAEYLEANRGMYKLADNLEHSDAQKHRHVRSRLARFIFARLRPHLRYDVPAATFRGSLIDLESGHDITLTHPELVPAPEPDDAEKEVAENV